MLPDEAALIGQWVAKLPLRDGEICLNMGSSTTEFRRLTQPFIYEKVIKPIESMGCRIVNCDLKRDDGVDEVGDVLDPDFQRRLMSHDPAILICSNLLEHLSNPDAFARACGIIVRPGGYCLFTVPRSFPYHPDPLDTMYRPKPKEISSLLPDWEVLEEEELSSLSYWDELRTQAKPTKALAKQLLRAMLPFYRPHTWFPAVHKLFWLWRPYKVSLVLLKKPSNI